MTVGELKQVIETLDDSVVVYASTDKISDWFLIESALKLKLNGGYEDDAECLGLLLNIKQQENTI